MLLFPADFEYLINTTENFVEMALIIMMQKRIVKTSWTL